MSSGSRLVENDGVIVLSGGIDRHSVPELWSELGRVDLQGARRIDLAGVTGLDGAGAAFLAALAARAGNAPLDPVPDQIRRVLDALAVELEPMEESRPEPPLVRLGGKLYRVAAATLEVTRLAADVMYLSATAIFGRRGYRRGAVVEQAVLIGLNATGVIALLAFIIGLILALQAAAQLRLVGANIFVADLVAISMVREMGPMMTAILIAGRSGSAMAAEIATMEISEELDALETMAIEPIRYVVVPKFLAITFCSPLLVTLATLVGIWGGLVIAVLYLGLPVAAYVNQVIQVLRMGDILNGLTKSVVFAWLIAVISSYCGMKAAGGAEGVGRQTTTSVVASIFAVITADVVFSLVYLP